ncbi:flagellar basal-body rod protein FlgF [Algimonas ampicilliniresistens]|uniref:Flagellar basal-body rod protein FlgF n=1 Tax=Algimonas ampicilliniresistens TaxID=1298735 RepID=A0ABQ5VA36_9PROT|nr:flagellar hook-basal body complex protein [Algimonas ampicilliniresistens]GLQ24348.1 flagellar basal-body rod protein FlgF [Algimonas ampicilliniresistens]
MDNAIYTMITRQSGLMREFSTVANNVANMGTTGFKAEHGVFSEYISQLEGGAGAPDHATSLSMGRLGAHATDLSDGSLRATGGALDMAINGEGFFQVQTAAGERLTRAGHFMLNAERILVDPMGNSVLGVGGGEIAIPLEASNIQVARDGTISSDGIEYGRIGVFTAPIGNMSREGNNLWLAPGAQPLENPMIASGFLEQSNVNPVLEMARMIEVQRHYDAGQSLMDLEDERIRSVAKAVQQMG